VPEAATQLYAFASQAGNPMQTKGLDGSILAIFVAVAVHKVMATTHS
jgi:hypothetical protein